MKWWLPIALAACGGSTGVSASKPTSKPAGAAQRVTVTAMRERVKAFCGPRYTTALPRPSTGEGCDWTPVTAGRAQLSFVADGDTITRVTVAIVAKEASADAARTAALELVADLFSEPERATVAGALGRLMLAREVARTDDAGTVGSLHVRASTRLDVARPAERTIELDVRTTGTATLPLTTTAPERELASPARVVTDTWLSDARAMCTELVDMVLKSHKAAMAPSVWEQGALHVDCRSPDENSVARFTVTWAPETRTMLYAYLIAELPQKKYAALADRLLTPLLTAGQWSVAKTATKKAPLDRKFEAEGLQIGSRHETGGFFGETHEIDISVQTGYGAGSSAE